MTKDVQRYDPRATKLTITPPLNALTRVQRRYLLEPWFTTIWAGTWTLSLLSGLAAAWTPLTRQFVWTAVLLFVTGIGAGISKGLHQDMNASTEGDITATPKPHTRSTYDDY